MHDRLNERKTILYIILAGVIVLCYYIAQKLPQNAEGVLFGMNYNLVSYAMIVGGSWLLFLIGIIIAEKKWKLFSGRETLQRRSVWPERITCVVLFLLAVLFLYRIYAHEGWMLGYSDVSLRNHLHHRIYAPFMLCFFSIFLIFDRNEGILDVKWARAAVCFAAALICAFCCYAPNPFLDEAGTLYHSNAYTNTIILVAQGKPYDAYNVSVYGHYGLLYWPLVKILGNNYQAIARAIVVVAFAAYGAFLWVCNQWIRKTSAFLMTVAAVCGISWMLFCTGQYYQVNPHRLLFPALTILFVSWQSAKKQASLRGVYCWEILLGTLSVIWNTETGIFSLAVLYVFNFLKLWHNEGREKQTAGIVIRRIAGSMGMVLVSFVLAYGVVNGYSLLAGGSLMNLERFVYPLLNHSYIKYIESPLPSVFSLYVVQIVIFSVGVFQGGFALYEKAKGLKDHIGREILLCCISVSGLAALTYFMNRTAYANISASWAQMALVVGLLADGAVRDAMTKWKEKRSLLSAAGKVISLLFLFVFAVESVLCFPKAIEFRERTDWQKEEMKTVSEWVRSTLPENTTGMGMGVPELFFETGRDPGCVLTDWPDIWIDAEQLSLQRARAVIQEGREYLFLESQVQEWYDLDTAGYEVVDSLQFGKFRYNLYLHIGSAVNGEQ